MSVTHNGCMYKQILFVCVCDMKFLYHIMLNLFISQYNYVMICIQRLVVGSYCSVESYKHQHLLRNCNTEMCIISCNVLVILKIKYNISVLFTTRLT